MQHALYFKTCKHQRRSSVLPNNLFIKNTCPLTFKRDTLIGAQSSTVCAYLENYSFNLLNPTGYVKHQQFNIQQLYVLPTQYLRVLYLSENKQRLVPLTA